MNDSTTVYSVVKYYCAPDHWLVGPQDLTCTKEGKWSGDAPLCECKIFFLKVYLKIFFNFCLNFSDYL